jgi:hypothetical protein
LRCFRDDRNPAFIKHRLETLVSHRISGIALSHEDLVDHKGLCFDPAPGLVPATLRLGRDSVPLAVTCAARGSRKPR